MPNKRILKTVVLGIPSIRLFDPFYQFTAMIKNILKKIERIYSKNLPKVLITYNIAFFQFSFSNLSFNYTSTYITLQYALFTCFRYYSQHVHVSQAIHDGEPGRQPTVHQRLHESAHHPRQDDGSCARPPGELRGRRRHRGRVYARGT